MTNVGAMHNSMDRELVSYELHILRGGNWKVDSVYDDKELAIEVARRLLDMRRTAAVRVLEETFADDNEIRSRTVFRRSVADDANREALERQALAAREAREARLNRAVQARQQQQAAKKPKRSDRHSAGWLLAKLVGIGIVGVAMLVLFGHLIYGR